MIPRILTLCLFFVLFAIPAQSQTPAAERQFTFAYRLLERGETDLALGAFKDFIRDYPKDLRVSDAAYYLALSMQQSGQLPDAKVWLEKATNPQHIPKAAVAILAGQVNVQLQDYPAAVTALEKIDAKAVEEPTTYATWRYLRGVAYEGVTRFEDAEKEFAEAAKPKTVIQQPAMFELGKLRAKMNKIDPAIEALLAASENNTSTAIAPEALKIAADLAYEAGQQTQAAEIFNRIITRFPQAPQRPAAAIGRLRSLLAVEQFGPIVDQYQSLSQVITHQDQAEALYIYAAASIRLKQYENGITALKLFYRNYTLKHKLGNDVAFMRAVAHYHTSLEEFDKWLLEIDSQIPQMRGRSELRYLQAEAAAKRKQWDIALSHFTRLVEEPAGLYTRAALLERAKVYEQLGMQAKAASDYDTYVKRFGKDRAAPSAARRSIDLAFAMGQYQQVFDLSEKWLAENPKDADASMVEFKVAVALMKLKRTDEAAKRFDALYEKSLSMTLNALVNYYRAILIAASATKDMKDNQPTPEQVDTIKKATAMVHKALKQKMPESQTIEAWAFLADLYRIIGDEKQAVEAFEQLRTIRSVDRFDAKTAIWVGNRLLTSNQLDQARIWLSDVQKRTDLPAELKVEVIFRLAQCDQRQKKWDEAAQKYQQVVAISKGYRDQGRLGLAQCLSEKGATEEAIAEYDGLINTTSSYIAATSLFESAMLYRSLADRNKAQGNTQNAEDYYQKALRRLHRANILYTLPELSPLPQRTLYELAKTNNVLNEPEKAKKYYDTLAETYKTDPWGQLGRVHSMILNGERSKAVFLLRTINEKSNDTDARTEAVNMLRQLGETP